jgi:hypothetical protein
VAHPEAHEYTITSIHQPNTTANTTTTTLTTNNNTGSEHTNTVENVALPSGKLRQQTS